MCLHVHFTCTFRVTEDVWKNRTVIRKLLCIWLLKTEMLSKFQITAIHFHGSYQFVEVFCHWLEK